MDRLKTRTLLCLLISLCLGTTAFSQDKDVKLSKKMKEALSERYRKDKVYAESQRGIYNREEWKKSWIGVKYTDMLKSWGAPTKSFPDGEGGQVAVYEKVSNFAGGEYKPGYIQTATNGFGQTVITGQKQAEDTRWASQYVETTTVYVGKDNLIKKVDNTINSSHAGNRF